ncbi:PKD domain-containing protein [Ferruginibacter albus]|uniref:PKD domain-containing protein n=1 Tax=Ferruginibacter albus TaxID=2875540 RepID=UPI001CC5AC20|nr:PKD domain-containing protein [Ferruginibacter albus]UAY51322.1 tandem-95 repeat protein [Ferruginibacter albus]
MRKLLVVFVTFVTLCVHAQTANDFGAVVPYTGAFTYGSNMGWFGNQFTDQDIATLAYNSGARSIRPSLSDQLITGYGINSRLDAFKYYQQLGMKDIAVFVGAPNDIGWGTPDDRDTIVFPGCAERAKTFKGMYLPIWLDAGKTQINPANTLAAYIYKTVNTYGPYVKFYEVVNEADFTYGNNGWDASSAGYWGKTNPAPAELTNVLAPIQYYIRMMHVCYDVIKRLNPNSYVCTGGLGYPPFLDALLRNTDNPVDGSVTTDYPLKGGAYFDVISYHYYPTYNTCYWDNSKGAMVCRRHSDGMASVANEYLQQFKAVLTKYKYDDVTYPTKKFIITEFDLGQATVSGQWGAPDAANNFIIKANILHQQLGILQSYKYGLGNGADASGVFNVMGVYGNLTPATTTIANAPITQQIYATRTESKLLYGKTYDAAQTTLLNLPSTIGGGAFKASDGTYTYVLWAKTTIDQSEAASASYTFPFAFSGNRMEWDYANTNATTVAGKTVALTGAPSFFVPAIVTNAAPTANAGTNQTIQLPTNNISLSGSGTDADGTIASYAWTKLSGGAATITSASSTSTTVTGLVQGTYQFVLTVTDNQSAAAKDTVTVTVKAANAAPTANAGLAQTIQLPTTSVSLSGSGTDADGSIASYAWTKLSGGAATITSASSASTTVTGLAQGTYQFVLTVTDNQSATAKDTVTVTVKAANAAPTANAGTDQTIQLPTNNISLSGSGTDADGTIASYAWTKLSGGTATITSASSASTTVAGLAQGTYQFVLTVTDNQSATAKDTVTVTVKAANAAPTANAGLAQTIQLPTNNISLSGSGTDADGSIAFYAWTKLSGGAATITSASSASTTVTGLVQGTYQFVLTVIDNQSAAAKDTVTVTVKAANAAPTANAGLAQTIQLPTTSVSLSGNGTDADGSIASYAWTKLSGGTATITSASSAATTVTGLVQGTYQFVLTVTDNQSAAAKDTVTVTVKAANAAPTANAGTDQTIQLPTNNISLSGSGTDADGTIASYTWATLSGGSATITDASSATTTVSNLSQGVYQFVLTVADNQGATTNDTVLINVLAANGDPIANAGNDQVIQLPMSSVLLNGNGIDADGSIASYNWSVINGTATIANASSASTTVNGLNQGVYQFVLTVKDNQGATASDTVQITVKAVNVAPTANAGINQSIQLPTNNISLSGSGTDIDGTIASYVWTKLSGGTATITSTSSASTTVTDLAQGTYQFVLTVTDNQSATGKDTVTITVKAANAAPTANAGTDQTIQLPTNSVSLSGSGVDADGTIASYSWSVIGGSATITDASSAVTTVNNLSQGVYQFVLTVTDNQGATATDTIKVTVRSANAAPTANAGVDQSIQLPTNSVSLSGSGVDADGTIASYSWSVIGGSATIADASSAATTVNNLSQGVYQFVLTVTDNQGATATDTVQVTVRSANAAPTANAGVDQSIQLPTNSVSLSGSGVDADGTIASYSWSVIGGSATITDASSAVTTVNNLSQGVYQFVLTVTDNQGATATDTVQVTVRSANAAPTANAGNDQTIQLPTNSVSLSGRGIDADGTIASYSWSVIGGSATITDASSAATTVNNLSQGVYQFVLTVTDNQGATATDTVQVTVRSTNAVPTANAGNDQTIQLPINSVSLSGSGVDADGTIASYSWSVIGGSATIADASSAATTVNNLSQGVYQFVLTVTDNQGATATDTVQVTVRSTNAAPTANAGTDQTIQLPTNSVSLSGSGVDADGTIASYSWSVIGGSATITDASSAVTTVNNLSQGVYQFVLTVTDNQGATATDTIKVTVRSANAAPTANAGVDQSIQLPTNSVSLSGSGVDADGTIASYSWSVIGGSATIADASSAATTVNNLSQGVYQFVLTVTDNQGATATDTVQVTVRSTNAAPTANAGTDQTIQLPTNSVTLSGSGVDADGTIASYSWSVIGGSATIADASSVATTVNNLSQGVYQFVLTVTDNQGATATDTVQVTVRSANAAPTANAGTDQTIQLPTNSVSLSGSGVDADGTIASYSWSVIGGSATITDASSAVTTVNNLSQGVYQFVLTVTDNQGATATDTLSVTVKATNVAPVSNAGTDLTIQLRTNTIILSGSGTDADGSIASYSWTKLSGGAATIANASSATTTVKGLVQGTYRFVLTVTDDQGATASDTIQVTVKPVNIPPTANAGANEIIIILPVNKVTLNGSGTDADGNIVSYQWSQVTGPSLSTITNAASASCIATELIKGAYKFALTVTDNNGTAAIDTVLVTVKENMSPTANAGSDQKLILPVTTTTLNGIGLDADGTIASYNWLQIAGPSLATISDSTSANTAIADLEKGFYQFVFTVTDNRGATGSDTVQITVKAPNVLPIANAGSDQTIQLPIDSIITTGTASDTDGDIVSYNWLQITGPSSATISNAATANAIINSLKEGVYQFAMTATDNDGGTATDTLQVVVQAANLAPMVNAGADQVIQLPTNTVSVKASGLDVDGNIVSYKWRQIDGPVAVIINNADASATSITSFAQGTYLFVVTATDNQGATASDTMQVIANIAPFANAGPDKTIQLPLNSVSITGSGVDVDGTVASYQWSQVDGPSTAIVNNATTKTAGVVLDQKGIYRFVLTVTDNYGGTDVDIMQVTVLAANIAPTANAGADQVVTLPINNATLTGSGNDGDGNIVAYQWTKISGGAATITNSTFAVTTITGLVQGTYQFALAVTDNSGATATDTMQVFVDQGRLAPVTALTANAGTDQSIALPTSTATLNGSGTAVNTTIVSYSWTKISGPSTGSISNAGSARANFANLVQGIYKCMLTVKDNKGNVARDTVSVVVNPSAQAQVTMGPNPTRSTLNIQLTNLTITNEPILVTVTNVSGITLYTATVAADQQVKTIAVDMSRYRTGIYFVNVRSKGTNKLSTVKTIMKN